MSELELQEDEKEVLLSIYDGDPAFNQHSPVTYQYKYGEDGQYKSFLLEISWGKNYPMEKPAVSMNAFYNKHLNEDIKQRVSACVLKEAEQYIGEAMTYTLFEYVKEKYSELIADLPDEVVQHSTDSIVQVLLFKNLSPAKF
uniref:RWD domain-containing protein n=1 Tax=Clastoptera arizonana TaxID=38151 RepID=A0A1B6C7P6_9HEMI